MELRRGINASLVVKVRTIKAGLIQLHRLADLYNIAILPGRVNELDPTTDEPVIRIRTNQSQRKKLWNIAHELGHILAINDYPAELLESFNASASGTFWELEDELQAWSYADILLRQLNPKFYSREYIKYKHQCLRTYYRQHINKEKEG